MVQGIVRVAFNIPILYVLWKYNHGYTRGEKWFIVLLVLLLVGMVVTPDRRILFLLFSFGGAAAAATQPYRIFRTKGVGSFSVQLLLIYTAAVVFWFVYGVAYHDLATLLMSISYIIVYGITLIAWAMYRPK